MTAERARRGLVLAGGAGTRLLPATAVVSKQLLPVYDKPMVYYALSVLMLAGIREICLITTRAHQPLFESLLGDGRRWGIRLHYVIQDQPLGLPHAYVLAEDFLDGAPSALILGDNLFFGNDLPGTLRTVSSRTEQNTIFGYWVDDPRSFGVVTVDAEGRPTALVEKPVEPASHWAIPGLYFLTNEAVAIARTLRPSKRGELEMVDLLAPLLQRGELAVERLGRGTAWLDGGTHDALLDAAEFVRVMEKRTGLKISCPEEIAFRMGTIGRAELEALARSMAGSSYGRYLLRLLDDEG